ncbi:2Fe-2S iron-sulfur cluster-binding protein [Chitinolyticbacter albus]|uniref:2Fe-2S iron-sulfur cluster-binding protein n=1 Tax=Chitinolyticbacter albus TaxID=2961951 RepID=UPI0021089373|nr:2Fe-2S iron-sulfur cluster binding domain-containing protein [Chitinolyticbacter albus]
MNHLSFVQGGCVVLRIDVPPGTRLIDVIRQETRRGSLSLPWRCAQGTCGACVLKLSRSQGPSPPVVLGRLERNVLIRQGQLPADAPLEQPDTPATPRLACHVAVDSDLIVYF